MSDHRQTSHRKLVTSLLVVVVGVTVVVVLLVVVVGVTVVVVPVATTLSVPETVLN